MRIRIGRKRHTLLNDRVAFDLVTRIRKCRRVAGGSRFNRLAQRGRPATALVATFFAAILGAEELRAASNLAALPAGYDANVWSRQNMVSLVPLVSAFSAAKSWRVEVGNDTTDAAHLTTACHA